MKILHILIPVIFLLFSTDALAAPDAVSGRVDLRGIPATESDSAKEDPGLAGRIRLDALSSNWQLHSWIEGGWDGTVQHSSGDKRVFKNFRSVYQSNSPFLEIKELYGSYSSGTLDIRAGIQRFSWGRLDEYPPNDLLNPWDYTQFLRKPLEERKIGVPSVSAGSSARDWTAEAVWVPVLVPYRLPLPAERWSGIVGNALVAQAMPNAEIMTHEPELPPHSARNSSIGLRVKQTGETDWTLTLFHGYDLHPVFRSTAFSIIPGTSVFRIDPGYVPDFHRISVIGMDSATVLGDWSLRAEAAYAFHRYLNIRPELWGYPSAPVPAAAYPLNPIERISDTVEYGIGADCRLFEDGLLTLQAQQTVLVDHDDEFYERKVETMLWANIKAGWMNQKFDTNLGMAYNPEHGDRMTKAACWYVFSDSWKAGVTAVSFTGPPQSLFGRYSRNDQIEAELVYTW